MARVILAAMVGSHTRNALAMSDGVLLGDLQVLLLDVLGVPYVDRQLLPSASP